MNIAGMEKCSMMDYPGLLAVVFFAPGCNFNCHFCHNRALLGDAPSGTWMGREVALAWLDERRGFLDAVVVSGGEPTLQPGLEAFVRAVRARGYRVKLDTNGSRPLVLGRLMREGLLDYVAMDIKAPPARYGEICGAAVDVDAVDASLRLLLDGPMPYEVRTTAVPQLTEADMAAIGRWVQGARRYVLQQFRRPSDPAALADSRNTAPPHPPDWPERVRPLVEPLVADFLTRGFDLSDRTLRAPIEALELAAI